MNAALQTVAIALTVALCQATLPTPEVRTAILDYHNQVRANVVPTATNMKKMVSLRLYKYSYHLMCILITFGLNASIGYL